MEDFKNQIATKMDDRGVAFPPTAEYTARRGNPVTITYEIPVKEHDDFYQAYVTALYNAFIDVAIDHTKFVMIIDQIYEELLAEYT